MDSNMLDIYFDVPQGELNPALKSLGYEFIGDFLYDYPPLPHKWSERIRTELYNKDEQLWYLMGIHEWSDDEVKCVRIGKVEIQNETNPETRLQIK